MTTLLMEAESFENKGGWVVDQQFMDQMGSPFLLAHGLGTPVADASTTVVFPTGGSYRLWVRTRDWVATWNAPGAPGKFQVLVNGKACPVTFGTSGADWHWQDGGIIEVGPGQSVVALHDLTGFEGRCDAMLFCSDHSFVPPSSGTELETFRCQTLNLPDQPDAAGSFDLVVTGGGIAGMCAALSAARMGLKTALVHDRPVLGGNNSSEVRVWLGGETNLQPYPHMGDLVKEFEPVRAAHYGAENKAEIYEDSQRIALLQAEPNLSLFLNQHVVAVETTSGRIDSITAQNITSARRCRYQGRLFADCTGDANTGFLAGADFDITLKGHMGPSNLWNVVDTGAASPFPRCPWALDLHNKPFPGRAESTGQYAGKGLESLGAWFWENGFAHHSINDAEQIRDSNFRAMYGAWDTLKNVDHDYPDYKLNWCAHIAGMRESRRLLGDVILSLDDIVQNRVFEDACFPCTWSVDLHYPHPEFSKGFEGREFISEAIHENNFKKPFWGPYRSLYSRNISNLFMAGRNISVTHEGLGTVRVMRTTGMMGEGVGMAAALCRKHGVTPREVYTSHLKELQQLMARGIGRVQG